MSMGHRDLGKFFSQAHQHNRMVLQVACHAVERSDIVTHIEKADACILCDLMILLLGFVARLTDSR